MQEALLAIGQKFSDTIANPDGLLAWIKTVILGGFENHKIGASDMPAIQVIYRGSQIEAREVGCTKMRATFDIHLVYNASSFTGESPLRYDKTKRIDTSMLISDQVEKRANCEYDATSIWGIILANQNLHRVEAGQDDVLIWHGWQIDSIVYGTFQRGAWNTYPTWEAIVSTTLFYKI